MSDKEFIFEPEREVDPAKPDKKAGKLPWSIFTAIVFVLALYFVTQIVAGLLVSLYPALQNWTGQQANDWLRGSAFAQFAYMAIVEGLTLGGLWWFLRRHKSSLRALRLAYRPRLADPVLAIAGFAVYFVSYVILVAVMSQLVPSLNIDQQQDVGFSTATGFVALSLAFVSLVILPPVVEEILMRGFLYGSLRRSLPFVPAMVATSAIFAAGHLSGGGEGAPPLWIAFIDTFVLSLVLCYLREKTGRLWAPIGLHMIKNGVAYVSLFILHIR